MSDEPITFHDLGTVTFREFDDGERVMGRPKFGQIRYFERQRREIIEGIVSDVNRLTAEFEEAQADEDVERTKLINEELQDLNSWGMVERMIPWYRAVFEQLSDPLPEDSDDWPGYFFDATLPGRLSNQWKMRPKASGANPAP